ncbi:hypothetical protein [Rhizobium leguminosarum]|uniref:hypothetical protein n=1 Tax=Rhizobium leguminosarum TaxID=384 RepID=UPI00103157ED|nr:hypothetical protein [Rhizobium leguminosarum]TAY68453.1 hypothetical protein ELH82_20840 [Rhizobium leguminosarum]
MLDKFKGAIDAFKRATSVSSVISESLEEIRQRIDDLKFHREEITVLPVTEEVAVSRAVQLMRMNIASAQKKVGLPLRFATAPDKWKSRYEPTDDFGSLMLAYLGDQLIDAVTAEIKQAYEDRPGITDQERQKRLDANDREILDAELMEEAIIRQAEQQGFSIERRVDADPRAVLAHESALP